MAYKGALMVDDEQFLAVLEETGKTGGLVMVHCENGDAVVRYQKEAMAAGNTDPKYHAWSRPPEVEGEATGRAIRLAEWTKRPLFVVHVTCEEAVREIRAARDRGLPIFGETCIQYLYLTVDDLDRPGFEGAKYVCSPPLREEQNQAVLYQALRQGALQGISTDHCPFNFKEQKELGLGDFTKIPNGLPAIEHRLTLLYDRSVRAGAHVDRGPRAPRLVGPGADLRARPKGALAPGFDADVVVFDPEVKHTISAEDARDERRLRPVRGLGGHRQAALRALARGDGLRGRQGRLARPGRGRFVKRSIFEPAVALMALQLRRHRPAGPAVPAARRADRQGRVARLRLGLDLRLADPVAGAVSADHAAGVRDVADADRHVRDQPGHARAGGDRDRPRDAAGHLRRADGDGHRPRRLRGARDGPPADEDRRVRAPAADDQGVHERPARWSGRAPRSSSSGRGTSPRSRSTSPPTARARWAWPAASATA